MENPIVNLGKAINIARQNESIEENLLCDHCRMKLTNLLQPRTRYEGADNLFEFGDHLYKVERIR